MSRGTPHLGYLPQGHIALGSPCEYHWPLVSQLMGWDLVAGPGGEFRESENTRVGCPGVHQRATLGKCLWGGSWGIQNTGALLGSSHDGPGGPSLPGRIFQELRNGVRRCTEKPCGSISGGVTEQGGGWAESRGGHLGGFGGLRTWCSLGVKMGDGLWEHLDGRSLGKQIMWGGQSFGGGWNLGYGL